MIYWPAGERTRPAVGTAWAWLRGSHHCGTPSCPGDGHRTLRGQRSCFFPSKEQAGTCVPWRDPSPLPQSRRRGPGAAALQQDGSAWWTACGGQSVGLADRRPSFQLQNQRGGQADRSASRLPGSPPAAPSPLWAGAAGPGGDPSVLPSSECTGRLTLSERPPLLLLPPQNKASPSQSRSLSMLKGQRTGMMWRVQPGASSDTSPAGPRHRVPTGSLRARLRDAAPAKGFSVSFGSGVLYPWCVPGLKL